MIIKRGSIDKSPILLSQYCKREQYDSATKIFLISGAPIIFASAVYIMNFEFGTNLQSFGRNVIQIMICLNFT